MITMAQTPKEYAPGTVHLQIDTRFTNKEMSAPHRPIPAPEPDPEPNPAPDDAGQAGRGHINCTDWDTLFRAVQARLEACVSDALLKQPQLPLFDRHTVTKTAVLECVQAMTQLHAELRDGQRPQPPRV